MSQSLIPHDYEQNNLKLLMFLTNFLEFLSSLLNIFSCCACLIVIIFLRTVTILFRKFCAFNKHIVWIVQYYLPWDQLSENTETLDQRSTTQKEERNDLKNMKNKHN